MGREFWFRGFRVYGSGYCAFRLACAIDGRLARMGRPLLMMTAFRSAAEGMNLGDDRLDPSGYLEH